MHMKTNTTSQRRTTDNTDRIQKLSSCISINNTVRDECACEPVNTGKRNAAEIILCFALLASLAFFSHLCENILHIDGLWTGVLSYLIPCAALVFYVGKIEKAPLSSIGLGRFCPRDIPAGLLLGLCMFALQQIPLLLMKMDYSVYAMQPDPAYITVISLYCFLCVGFAEELIFRGFILHKTLSLCGSKILSVGINILLFYAIHFYSMQFVFGEFYNIAANVLLLCLYLFLSRRKSIVPLMIAHGFYDTLTSVLLPLFVYYHSL